jgi:protein gp37
MGTKTKIAWCDHTFNPWYGCRKIGAGCAHCYAEEWARRFGMVTWGRGAPRKRSSAAVWKKPLAWNAEAKRLGVRRRVFCASLADVFDEAAPGEWRADLFALIRQTPNLDWLLLTKRIFAAQNILLNAYPPAKPRKEWPPVLDLTWLENVWLGISISNQEEADRDIPKLMEIPARKLFLSCEPLLGPINLNHACQKYKHGITRGLLRQLDWVIVGGESGPMARPMAARWARSIRDQCAAANVPFFFKQWGEWLPVESNMVNPFNDKDSYLTGQNGMRFEYRDVPRNFYDKCAGWLYTGDGLFRRAGKERAGRLLDGVLHDEFPD